MARATVYLHFADRAALMLALVRHVDEKRGLENELRKIHEAHERDHRLARNGRAPSAHEPEGVGFGGKCTATRACPAFLPLTAAGAESSPMCCS
jgi:AcrR family transcriptional regulator